MHPSVQAKNVREFIALAKAKPGVKAFVVSSDEHEKFVHVEIDKWMKVAKSAAIDPR